MHDYFLTIFKLDHATNLKTNLKPTDIKEHFDTSYVWSYIIYMYKADRGKRMIIF